MCYDVTQYRWIDGFRCFNVMPSLPRLINYAKLGLILEDEGKTFIPNFGRH